MYDYINAGATPITCSFSLTSSTQDLGIAHFTSMLLFFHRTFLSWVYFYPVIDLFILPNFDGYNIRMQRYQYKPVSEDAFEARFLILLPGEREDPVQGLLVTRTLTKDDYPDYEALSYAWGSLDFPTSVAIRTVDSEDVDLILGNSNHTYKSPTAVPRSRFSFMMRKAFSSLSLHTHQSPSIQHEFGKVSITQNLGRALPYLRLRDRPRTMWIDAICVNQEDLPERSQQVQRMADVYRLASRAVVWLGEESADSHLAISFLKELCSKVGYDQTTKMIYGKSSAPADSNWADHTSPIEISCAQVSQLIHLFERSWFHRLWILQEIHLAKRESFLICGEDEVLWLDIRDCIQILNLKGIRIWNKHLEDDNCSALKLHYRRVSREVLYMSHNKAHLRMASLLAEAKHSQCSDQRDRVYALLSLAGPEQIDIMPDYTQSIEWVFENATCSIFDKSRSINLLAHCELSPQRSTKLPSWVPDFSVTKLCQRFRYTFISSLPRPALIEEACLKTRGVQVATIRAAWSCRVTMTTSTTRTNIAEELRRLYLELNNAMLENEPAVNMEDFISTMIQFTFAESYYPAWSAHPSISELGELKKFVLGLRSQPHSHVLDKYYDKATHLLRHKKIFLTTEGHIGVCLPCAMPGDIIVLLAGCRQPLVLRPQGTGQYVVVCEAIQQDIMNGEPFLGPLPPGWECLKQMYSTGKVLYMNRITGEKQCEDPRLGELPDGWSRVSHTEEKEYATFREEKTGKEYDSRRVDPRTFPEELEKRGAKLQDFMLV